MGLSFSNLNTGLQAPLFGRQAQPTRCPQSADAIAEQQRISQIQAKYGEHSAAARSAKPDGNKGGADAMLSKLKAEREAHIMGHERAHQSAAGAFGGGIHIDRDSNGVAIGGHVPISIPPLDPKSPETSLKNYNTIKFAALAPGDPSGQDMAVASMAQGLMGRAQVLINQKQQAQSLGLSVDDYKKLGKPKKPF